MRYVAPRRISSSCAYAVNCCGLRQRVTDHLARRADETGQLIADEAVLAREGLGFDERAGRRQCVALAIDVDDIRNQPAVRGEPPQRRYSDERGATGDQEGDLPVAGGQCEPLVFVGEVLALLIGG